MSQPQPAAKRISASRTARPHLKRRGTSTVLVKPEAKARKVAKLLPSRQCIAWFSVQAANGPVQEYAKHPQLERVRYMISKRDSDVLSGDFYEINEDDQKYQDFEYQIEEGEIQPEPGFLYRVAAVASGRKLYAFGQFIKVQWQDSAILCSKGLKVDIESARKADAAHRIALARRYAQEAIDACQSRLRETGMPVAPTRLVSRSRPLLPRPSIVEGAQ